MFGNYVDHGFTDQYGRFILTVDVYQKYINKNTSPKRSVTVARIATFLTAAIALVMA